MNEVLHGSDSVATHNEQLDQADNDDEDAMEQQFQSTSTHCSDCC